MSYYPQQGYQQPGGYGMPQQQPMGLPFSNTELMYPINQLAYGQPPVNMQLQTPPELQSMVPLILNQLAIAIQERATANQLRIFLYNQQAANNFNNQDFLTLANLVGVCVDLVMRTQPGANIEAVVAKAARNVAEFMTAMNANQFPALTMNLPPADIQGIQSIIAKFDQEIQGMKQQLSPPPQQQGSWGQPNTWGQQQPPQGQYGGYQPQQPQRQYGGGHQAATHGYGGIAAPAAPVSAPAWRGRPVGGTPVKQVTAIPPEATAIPSARRTFRSGVTPIGAPTKPVIRTVEPTLANLPPPPIIPKTDIEVYDDSGFNWLLTQGLTEVNYWRSTQLYPYSVAYNPTLFNTHHLNDTKGNVRTVLVNKDPIPMDRTAHLTAPKISPSWSVPIYAESVAMDRFDRKMAIVFEDLVYEKYPGGISQTSSTEEHWAMASTYLGAVMINNHNKRQVVRIGGVVAEPSVCNPLFKLWVGDLSKLTTPAEAQKYLKNLIEDADQRTERHDAQLASKINRRLTNRINRFITNELALTSGVIDSFVVDISELPPHLEKKFGEGVKATFLKAFSGLVADALTFAENGLHKDIVEYYCGEYSESLGGPAGDRDLLSFFQHNEYAYVDLSSVELQVDLATTQVAVGVKESLTPLFYGVCEDLLGVHDYVTAKQESIRYYIRTNDDVTFEINRGAMNKEFFFVSLAK